MELFKAHAQWANRPEDERFTSLESLHAACKEYAGSAAEKDVAFADLRVENVDGDVRLVGKAGVSARLTHWAFGQLCSKVEAPASYLRELPATLACQNLNHGLAQRVKDAAGRTAASLLFHRNGSLLLRAITTDAYTRIWNHEVAERLLDLQIQGWTPAKPDIRVVDNRLPLYASDHDMFAFLSNKNVTVQEAGGDGAMYRGVIVENSEVGASALKLTRFLYREMCGNHIIWGASNVIDISVRHVGSARQKWGYYAAKIRQYAEGSVSEDEAKIKAARSCVIGGTKTEVLDALFGKRQVSLSRRVLEAGYDAVVPREDGDPATKWGIMQGLTRYSQTLPYADERTRIDKAAGRIMEVEF
jgi:hypothetical protein